MPKPLRVLILEDSESDAELLLLELRRRDFEPIFLRVDTPEGMTEALDRESWSLVISDYSMPRFSALHALDLLKRRGLDLPFIIVSGTIGEEVAVSALKNGAHDYLIKGHLTRLAAAVERELRDAEERSSARRPRKRCTAARSSCARPRRWRRSADSREEWRTISTIF